MQPHAGLIRRLPSKHLAEPPQRRRVERVPHPYRPVPVQAKIIRSGLGGEGHAVCLPPPTHPLKPSQSGTPTHGIVATRCRPSNSP